MSFYFKASAKSKEDAMAMVMSTEGQAASLPDEIRTFMCKGITNTRDASFILNPGDTIGFHLEASGHLAHGNDYPVTEAKVKVEPFSISVPPQPQAGEASPQVA